MLPDLAVVEGGGARPWNRPGGVSMANLNTFE